jgi:hypothetical protein
MIEYSSQILKFDDIDATHCKIPFDVAAIFGKKRVKIKATFDGRVVYRGLLTPYSGDYFLMINKEIRAEIGKNVGEMVDIRIEEDTEPRIVEVADDFAKAMDEAGVRAFFDKMSFTHRKEYARWIEEAKREETRLNRIAKAVVMIQEGKKGI